MERGQHRQPVDELGDHVLERTTNFGRAHAAGPAGAGVAATGTDAGAGAVTGVGTAGAVTGVTAAGAVDRTGGAAGAAMGAGFFAIGAGRAARSRSVRRASSTKRSSGIVSLAKLILTSPN